MNFRPYDPARDLEAVRRIWRECGWITDDVTLLDIGLVACRNVVADLDGSAECVVSMAPGSVRYLESDLPFSLVAGVATSHVARRQGLASTLTASAVAEDAAAGAVVSGLGMFDQGFYDRLGFGTGSSSRFVEFDPASLRLPAQERRRAPKRIGPGDYEAVHANRIERARWHGACNIEPSGFSHVEMIRGSNGFGLGFFDGPGGALSHHLWCRPDNPERGPYRIRWMAWRTSDELLELLRVVASLGDQVALVRMQEPPGVQIQALLDRPWREINRTRRAEHEQRFSMYAWWQMRIDDVERAVAALSVRAKTPLRFNVRLRDPIERWLPPDAPWRGVAGDYVVEIGEASRATRGSDSALPVLEASVNAFTRLWLGVSPASGLAVTDDFRARPELLARLDETLRLPEPRQDWDY